MWIRLWPKMKTWEPGYDDDSSPLLSIHYVPGTWHLLPHLTLTITLQNGNMMEILIRVPIIWPRLHKICLTSELEYSHFGEAEKDGLVQPRVLSPSSTHSRHHQLITALSAETFQDPFSTSPSLWEGLNPGCMLLESPGKLLEQFKCPIIPLPHSVSI